MSAFIIPLMVFAACEKNNSENKNNEPQQPDEVPVEVTNASDTMRTLIEEGKEYDITNIESALNGKTGYWRVDAIVEYIEDYSAATAVVRSFGNELWSKDFEPVVSFAADGKLNVYSLSQEDRFLAEESGEWAFTPRTQEIAASYPAFEGNDATAIDGKLIAASDNALIIEWQSAEGKALRSAYVPVEMDEMLLIEANEAAAITVERCCNYDVEAVGEMIVGVWNRYTVLTYDAEWQGVIEVPGYFYGEVRVEGGSLESYTFNADGTGLYARTVDDPSIEGTTKNFSWNFDAATKKLTLTGDLNSDFTLSGLNNNLLILDSTTANKNVRTMFSKREQ